MEDEDETGLGSRLPRGFPKDLSALGYPCYRIEAGGIPPKLPMFCLALVIMGVIGAIAFVHSVNRVLVDPPERFLPGQASRTELAWSILWCSFPWMVTPLAILIWIVVVWTRNVRSFAVVFTEGFVSYDGRRYEVWRWDDVQGFFLQHYEVRETVLHVLVTNRYHNAVITLRHASGATFSFATAQGPRATKFGRLVEDETFRRMLPVARGLLLAGKPVDFKPLRISPEGIVSKGKLLTWANLKHVSIKNGQLHLTKAIFTLTRAPFLGEIENSHVFLALLQESLSKAP